MKRSKLTLMAALSATIVACSPKVETQGDVNPSLGAEITTWRSYAWMKPQETGDSRIDNAITRARVEAAVNRELAALGFEVNSEDPDFRIAWHATIDTRLDVRTIYDAYSYRWGWYGPDYGTYVESYDQGTLILDFVDTNRNELAWRGIAQGRLSRATAQQPSQDQIDEAVEEVMEEFPATLPR